MRRNRIRARLLRKKLASPTKLRNTVALPVGTTKKIRNLDLNQLIAEARALVDAVSDQLAGLERDRSEAAELLTQINEPDFWDRIDHREIVLDQYRANTALKELKLLRCDFLVRKRLRQQQNQHRNGRAERRDSRRG